LASFDCYYYDSKGYITTGPANTHTHTHTRPMMMLQD
jgi:hypothetical protein